ncbi:MULTISPECIES: hypothetical protein [Bacteroidota]|uniref:hypothetical protein n=2 Tax=Bacteroidota TaxID=976 RepID=UPI004048C452
MNVIIKVSMANYDAWKETFDNHAERATVCDESKTTVGKVDETSAIVMLYDVDMQKMQGLFGSEFMVLLIEKMEIVNDEMHSFTPLQP